MTGRRRQENRVGFRWVATACISAVATALVLSSPAALGGDILVYLSSKGAGENAMPEAPQESLDVLPVGGSFHIWIDTDDHLTGVSLDVETTGDAIRFTDSTVHNPDSGSDARWLNDLIRDGTVTDSKVTRIEGGALVGVTDGGEGIGPSVTGADDLYEASAGFLFATLDFIVDSPTGSGSAWLKLGHNLFGDTSGAAAGDIYFGVADGPVSNSAGSGGSVSDMELEVIQLQAADFNSDGDVTGIDFSLWQRGLGITSGATRVDGDADGNGAVNALDLTQWQTQYGTTPASPAAAPIPEPSHLVLAACGLAPHLLRFRTRNPFAMIVPAARRHLPPPWGMV